MTRDEGSAYDGSQRDYLRTSASERRVKHPSRSAPGRRLPVGAGAAKRPFADMRSLSIVCVGRTMRTAAPGQRHAVCVRCVVLSASTPSGIPSWPPLDSRTSSRTSTGHGALHKLATLDVVVAANCCAVSGKGCCGQIGEIMLPPGEGCLPNAATFFDVASNP